MTNMFDIRVKKPTTHEMSMDMEAYMQVQCLNCRQEMHREGWLVTLIMTVSFGLSKRPYLNIQSRR